MLQHLITCALRSPAINIARSTALLKRRSILTHINPPDVIQRARPQTVHSFAVVRAYDGVGQGRAVLQEKYGVGVAAFGLLVACRDASVPLLHPAIEGFAGRDGLGGGEQAGAGGLGERGLQCCVSGCAGDMVVVRVRGC